MATPALHLIHRQLTARRERLRGALSAADTGLGLRRLLDQVDSALARFDAEEYGRCLVCHEEVDEADLARNPLLEYCLCALTPAQQDALGRDLTLARRIQGGLLPDPKLRAPGWEAAYSYEPAEVVSGDYVDLWQRPAETGSFFFAVGDVAGKGVAASLLMAHLQAACRALHEADLPLGELLARVNRQLLRATLPEHFATLVCGRAGAGGEIEITNAGHCPPLLLRAGGVEPLNHAGLPVGVAAEHAYTVQRLRLAPGEALLLYTDGITEARRGDDDDYGQARLEHALRQAPAGAAPADLVQAVARDLRGFLGGAPGADDLTVLALRRAA